MSNTIDNSSLLHKLNKFEIQCVTGNFTDNDFHFDVEHFQFSNEFKLIKDLDTIMKNVSHHEYAKALQINSEFFKPFKDMCKDLTLVFYEMYSQMKSNYQYLFHSGSDDCSYVKQLILLLVGVSALQEFVRVNICCPFISDAILHEICSNFLPDPHFSDESILNALGQNGEVILTSISHPKLLFLSLVLLFGNNFDKCLTHKWWLSRCMMIHQKILPDSSSSLYRSINSLIHSQAEISFLCDKSEPLAAFMFNCECAQFFLLYNELNAAERYIINAQNILGLGIKLPKYCTRSSDKTDKNDDTVIKRNDKRYQSNLIVYNNHAFPNKFFDSDSYRWEKVILLDYDRNEIDELLPEEQMVLLLYYHLFICRKYDSDINFDEDLPILDCLMSKPKVWSVQMKALILKCTKREYFDNEQVNQARELILHISNNETIFAHKLVLFYCTSLPMMYNIHKILADVLFRTGHILEASEIYKEYHLWKGSINCYKHFDLIGVGVKELEELISIKPSPLLWCYLGKLKDESEIYKVAWDLSGHSNARAARYMGYHFYKIERYAVSITYFKDSLKLISMQPKVLLYMGFAALSCNDFTTAIEAFNGVLEMDTDNCEAWTYLCKAYIKNDDKVDACKCFVETMKFNTSRMNRLREAFWENYLLISAKISAFSDVISGFHSYLDEKLSPFYLFANDKYYRKYLSSSDLEVLRILVNAIKTDAPDINHIFSLKLKRKALKLFKRMTSHKCHYPIVWELYSVLMCIRANFRNMHTTKKIIACQQKAIKHYMEQLEKENCSPEPVLKLLLKSLNLFDIYAMNLKYDPSMTRRQRISYNNFNLFFEKALRRFKSFTPYLPRHHGLLCEIEQKLQSIV